MLLLAALFLGIFSESGFFSYAIGGKEPEKDKTEEIMLIPGGTPFGVRFYTEGALVYRLEEGSPAEKAGLKAGDLIVKVNGQELPNAGKLLLLLETSGDAADLEVQRKGRTLSFRVPLHEESGRMLGVHVRDSVAGIGTITYYDGEKGVFAGLGHGLCDGVNGSILPLSHGSVTKVRLTSVKKGEKGLPGQLRGVFCPAAIGEVTANTEQGIFGKCDPPKGEKALPAAQKNEVHEGDAEILSTLTDGQPGRYKIRIEKILSMDSPDKNYLLRVTDKELLELSGGIVQGMSGSPILQDGRIVGAVTHVLLEDPQKGYGIYIGNMLGK